MNRSEQMTKFDAHTEKIILEENAGLEQEEVDQLLNLQAKIAISR